MSYVSPSINYSDVALTQDYIAWYIIAAVIVAALAVTVVGACIIICEAKGKTFSGQFYPVNGGWSFKIGCM